MCNFRCRLFTLAISACLVGYAAEARAQSPTSDAGVLTLDMAISLALRDNPRLRNASLDVERSQQDVAAERTRRLPSFKFEAFAAQQLTPIDYTFERGVFGTYPGVGPIPNVDTKISTTTRPTSVLSTRVDQPLSRLHQINLNIHLLELRTGIADEELRSARLQITADVKRSYYALLGTDSALKAADETIRMYDELDRVTTDFVAQQVALKTDSLDVKSRLARAEYDRQLLRDRAENQKQQLNQLLGRDVLTEFSVAGVPKADLFEAEVSVAREQALAQRPEIREAHLKVQQADVERRVKKADFVPEVSVGFQHIATLGFDNFIPKNSMNVGVTVTWEVFDWGRKKHELAEKDLVAERARNDVRDAERSILVDVDDRFNHLREARQLLTVTQMSRDAAVENVRVVANRYKAQKSLLRDVLQAQSQLEQASDQTRQALLSFWTAKADFEIAIGKEQ